MKIVFMGTPDFAVSSLAALLDAGHEVVLCVTQPDRPKGRGGKVQFSDVKEFALARNIPVFQPVKIREPEAVARLREIEADIFVVAAFGQILPEEILTMPPLGCVNVHASLLPKYRGAAPIQWSILNGDKTTGVTIMQMGVGLDDGDILSRREVEILPEETGGSLFEKLAKVGGELLTETLPKLASGEITPVPQDEALATKVGMIRKELGKLDFSRSAAELERYIRGLSPWPSAYAKLNGKTVKLCGAAVLPLPEGAENAAYGEVVFVDKHSLYVKTGEGVLSIKELQPEGKKRMPVTDFLNGTKVEKGMRFS